MTATTYTCQRCREPISIGADGKWHDGGDLLPSICDAGTDDEAAHLPVADRVEQKLTRVRKIPRGDEAL